MGAAVKPHPGANKRNPQEGKAAEADGMLNAMEAAENTRKFYSGEAPPGM